MHTTYGLLNIDRGKGNVIDCRQLTNNFTRDKIARVISSNEIQLSINRYACDPVKPPLVRPQRESTLEALCPVVEQP